MAPLAAVLAPALAAAVAGGDSLSSTACPRPATATATSGAFTTTSRLPGGQGGAGGGRARGPGPGGFTRASTAQEGTALRPHLIVAVFDDMGYNGEPTELSLRFTAPLFVHQTDHPVRR